MSAMVHPNAFLCIFRVCNNLPSWCALSLEEIITGKVSFSPKNKYLRLNGNDFKSGFGGWTCHNPILGYSQKNHLFFKIKIKKNKTKVGSVEKAGRGIKLQFCFYFEKKVIFGGITQNWVMTVAPLFTMLTIESLVRDFR